MSAGDYGQEPSTTEMLRIDGLVRTLLGVQPSETIEQAARRVIGNPSANVRERGAAHAILGGGPPWARMIRAAAFARLELVK